MMAKRKKPDVPWLDPHIVDAVAAFGEASCAWGVAATVNDEEIDQYWLDVSRTLDELLTLLEKGSAYVG